jgi:citrate lyase subunit beta/citryl-CoA lyase
LAYAKSGVGNRLLAIRANAYDSPHHADDVAALKDCAADFVVLPKVEDISEISDFGVPVLAMVETPAGLFNARSIAGHPRVAGLIAGINDIAAQRGYDRAKGRGISLHDRAGCLNLKPRLTGSATGWPIWTDMMPNAVRCNSGLRARPYSSQPDRVCECSIWARCRHCRGRRTDYGELRWSTTIKGRMIESMHVEEAKLTIERSRHAMNHRLAWERIRCCFEAVLQYLSLVFPSLLAKGVTDCVNILLCWPAMNRRTQTGH